MPTREELLEDMERERKKKLKLLEATFEMHENSKKDTERKLRKKMLPDGTPKYSPADIKKQVELIQGMQDEVVEEYLQNGGDMASLEAIKKKKRVSPDIKQKDENGNAVLSIYDKTGVIEYLKSIKNKKAEPVKGVNDQGDTHRVLPAEETLPKTEFVMPHANESKLDVGSVVQQHRSVSKPSNQPIEIGQKEGETSWITQSVGTTTFDVIPLPSKGQCYPSKKDRIPVSYLTAYDENIIVSPNLYRDNLVLDYVIKNKVMNNAIDPDELVVGDRDAIILWLRATGYGPMYPVKATDNETGKQFETLVDLSQIKFKPFNLIGDENGWFDFETPLRHDKIKFRYLTARDLRVLDELDNDEERRAAAARLKNVAADIQKVLDMDNTLNREEKTKIFDAQDTLSDWADELEASESDNKPFNSTVTNRMEVMMCEVNGNRDREFIHSFVNTMNVRDASAFRSYVLQNEPGLDYNITIERPESIGGGSVTLFLQLDQLIFLNIPE